MLNMKRLLLLLFSVIVGTTYAQTRLVPFSVDSDGKKNIDYSHVDTVWFHLRDGLDNDHGTQLYESSVVRGRDSVVYNVDLYTGPSEDYDNDGRSSFFSVMVTTNNDNRKSLEPADNATKTPFVFLGDDGFVPSAFFKQYDFGNHDNRNYIKVDMEKSSLLLFTGAEWFPDASVLSILWLHDGEIDLVFNAKAEIVKITRNKDGYLFKLHEGCLYFDEPERKPKCTGMYISKTSDHIMYYDTYPSDIEKDIFNSNKGRPSKL